MVGTGSNLYADDNDANVDQEEKSYTDRKLSTNDIHVDEYKEEVSHTEVDPFTNCDGAKDEDNVCVDTNTIQEEENKEEGEEEELECGFCLFMKGGGCKDNFIAWEKCVEEAEKNKEEIVEKCFEVTALLKKCMDAHSDYYEPILRAEKAMEEEATRELKEEATSSDTTESSF